MQFRFHASATRRAIVGPAAEFVACPDSLYTGARRVAEHRGGFWIIDDVAYVAGESDDRVCLHAEDEQHRTSANEPVTGVRLADGAIQSHGETLWRLLPSGRWRQPLAGDDWSRVVLRDPT